MNNAEFMEQLKAKLKRLPKEEFDEAVAYYEEYLSEGGDEALKKLGTPEQVAAKICADYVEKPKEEQGDKSTFWIVLLTICSIPILFPVGIALLSAAFAIIVVAFSIVVAMAGMLVAGLVSGVMGFTLLASNPLSAFFFIGSGMFAAALSYFAITWLWDLVKWLVGLLVSAGGKILRRFSK